MSSIYHKDSSFDIAAFFLKITGFWFASSRGGKWFRNGTIGITVLGCVLSTSIQIIELYFSFGDFADLSLQACDVFVSALVYMKLILFIFYRKKFLNLIAYMQENLWHSDHDDYENAIVADTKHTCLYFVCFFSFFTESTILSYIVRAFISNIGKSGPDRALMFDMHLDLPLNVSPYFEIAFTLQVWGLSTVGIGYVCFDNMFCIMCLHAAAQFRILQYRLAKMPNVAYERNSEQNESVHVSKQCYERLKRYVAQHNILIEFVAMLEDVYKVINLGQMLLFSVIICFVGYPMLQVGLPLSWRITFMFYIMGVMSHLWVFTYSCDCVMRESLKISSATYEGPWIHLSMDKFGKMVRKDMQMVVLRSREASCLTACGFFPISLETYTKVMSTAMSYFTLLRQSAEGTV